MIEIDCKNSEIKSDGRDFYWIILNLKTREYIRVKNSSCSANALKTACQYFGIDWNWQTQDTLKDFFMGSEKFNINRIPKKYWSLFKKEIN